MTALLPRKSDTQRQGKHERMFRTIGFDATACRDIVLKAWFGKEAKSWSEVVLQTETYAK